MCTQPVQLLTIPAFTFKGPLGRTVSTAENEIFALTKMVEIIAFFESPIPYKQFHIYSRSFTAFSGGYLFSYLLSFCLGTPHLTSGFERNRHHQQQHQPWVVNCKRFTFPKLFTESDSCQCISPHSSDFFLFRLFISISVCIDILSHPNATNIINQPFINRLAPSNVCSIYIYISICNDLDDFSYHPRSQS